MLFPIACGTTIVLSSFLLFLVQPILAKQILPWFGGTSAVWTTCMVFFQCALLAGYVYANWLQARPRIMQRRVHMVLLAAAVLSLPIIPSVSWKPTLETDSFWQINGLLLATVGLPYFSLAATSPLLQRWLSHTLPSAAQPGVYRLFAWSNAGSLAALLAYPFIIEPWVSSRAQSWSWSVAYGVFALLCAWVAWRATRPGAAYEPVSATAAVGDAAAAALREGSPPGARHYALWIVLSMVPSAFLLAVTTHLTQNVASIPFLWLVPLSIYLVSFMLVFDGRGGRGWYVGTVARLLWLLPALGATVAMTWGLSAQNGVLHIQYALPLFTVGLLLACVVCHGELAAARPAPRYLTRFYLCMSLGGAIGGLGVGLAAPVLLNAYWELPGLLIALAGVGVWASLQLGRGARRLWVLPALAAVVATVWFTHAYVQFSGRESVSASRDFYGVLRVRSDPPGDSQMRRLMHGTIMHGEQFTKPDFRGLATSYYGETSGVGRALTELGRRGPLRVGAVGLGVGTLLSYGRSGDTFVVYELDSHVLEAARRWFTYLPQGNAQVDVRIGDARLTMERELAAGKPGKYDLVVVDAFSSDSIPMHLMTKEALAVYVQHLNEDGLVAFHVSNRYLALAPVVAELAHALGLKALSIEDTPELNYLSYTDWVLVGKSFGPALLNAGQLMEPQAGARPWTDSYNNLFKALKF
ncbi:MAG: fused MFS/spermidine synthase [Burkholderiaceae bacterium]|nr:fused MFS/spermidine synthase [Burkholderiaceae bacterium]MDO9089937.1 fused MFS/spermidine synthase [Burkholderiaceae bacterium]